MPCFAPNTYKTLKTTTKKKKYWEITNIQLNKILQGSSALPA